MTAAEIKATYEMIEVDNPPPGEVHRFVFCRVDHEQRVIWMWRLTPPAWRAYSLRRAIALAAAMAACPLEALI